MNLHRLNQLQEKLRQLIARDREMKTFGANEAWGGHQYQLNPPLSELDVNIFESAHHISLPEEYRLFLTQIANGGAGPYYGLYSLEKSIEEAEYYATQEDTPLEKSFATEFPLSNADVQAFMDYYTACIEEGEDDTIQYPEVPDLLTGVLFLSQYGCGWSLILVVKGEQSGTIWWHGEHLSPCFHEGKQWTFFDWYEDWLDRSLAQLNPQKVEKQEFDTSKTIVNYDGWKMKEIPAEVFQCKNLKKLVFSRNELHEFPLQITQFSELKTLDLSMNPLIHLPDELGKLKKLKRLFLNYNYHTDLPQGLAQLQNLEELSMFYNYKIPAIPEVVTHLTGLKKLSFSYCSELKKLPENIGDLTRLELLQLNDCDSLGDLPESMVDLENLKFLYLDNTKLKKLPDNFENLQNLEALGLNIAGLDLEDVVEKIKNLPKLYWLRISLQLDYPLNFSELKRIKVLTIEQNYELWHQGYKNLPVPENVSLIPNLEELNLMNNNQAQSLPENIGKLKNLKKLEIGATSIQHFPESMQFLSKLEQVSGSLNEDQTSPFGVLPEEKTKLEQWFPKAKIWIG